MNQVTQFNPPRLPYHEAIEERYGIDKSAWKALTEAVFPSAKTVDSVIMALSYCRARKLDPFKRPVNIVPMYSAAKKGYVDTIWPGISELRTTASRTGEYSGCSEAEFGPEVTLVFKGNVKVKGQWSDVEVEVTYPEWCRLTVHRVIKGASCAFIGPKVKWIETYGKRGGSKVPNDMWATRPVGQLEKCAEAAALRRAFPEEIGNSLTSEEMQGQQVFEYSGNMPVIDHQKLNFDPENPLIDASEPVEDETPPETEEADTVEQEVAYEVNEAPEVDQVDDAEKFMDSKIAEADASPDGKYPEMPEHLVREQSDEQEKKQ